MTVYIGCDYHPHQQTLAWMDTAEGEIRYSVLSEQTPQRVREFYRQFPAGSEVGMEATGACGWFEELLTELGHRLLVGDARQIRKLAPSRHKTDRRDAEHLLDLLVQRRFPELWRRPLASQLVLEQLRYRHGLVKQRTFVCNRLQVLGQGVGLPRLQVRSKKGGQLLAGAELDPVRASLRAGWFRLLEQLSAQIDEIEQTLRQQAASDRDALRLQTHPGIGPLTSLCFVHTVGDVRRFYSARQVISYVGLDPVEKSSGDKKRIGKISKRGSALLRFLLGQAAHAAIKGDVTLKSFYQQVSRRRGRSIAKVATARKLCTRAYLLLRDEIDYAEYVRRGTKLVGTRSPQGYA